MEMKRSQSAIGRLAKKVTTAFNLPEVQASSSKTPTSPPVEAFPLVNEQDRRISSQSNISLPSSPRRKSFLLRRPSFSSKKMDRKAAQDQLEGLPPTGRQFTGQAAEELEELEGLMIRVGGSGGLSQLADARQSFRMGSAESRTSSKGDLKGKGKVAVRPERPSSFYHDLLGPVPTAAGTILPTAEIARRASLGPGRPAPPPPGPAAPQPQLRSGSIPNIHVQTNTPIPYDPDDTHPDNFAPRRRVGSVSSLSTRRSHRYTPSQSSNGTRNSQQLNRSDLPPSRSRNQSIVTFNSETRRQANPQPFRPEPQPAFPEPDEMPEKLISPPLIEPPVEPTAEELQASHWSPSTVGENTPPQLPSSPPPVVNPRHSSAVATAKRQSVRSGIFNFNGETLSSGLHRLAGKPKKKKRVPIVVVGAQRIGAGRYAAVKEAADMAAALRKNSLAVSGLPQSRKASIAVGRRPSVAVGATMRRPSVAVGPRKASLAPIAARRGSTAGTRRGSSILGGDRRRSSGTEGSRRTSLDRRSSAASGARKSSTASGRKPSLTPTFPPPVFINSFATDSKRQQGLLEEVSLDTEEDDSVLYSILDESWEDADSPPDTPPLDTVVEAPSPQDSGAFVAASPDLESPDLAKLGRFEAVPRRLSLAPVASVGRLPDGHPANHHSRFTPQKIAQLPRLDSSPPDVPPLRSLTPTKRKPLSRRQSKASIYADELSGQRDSMGSFEQSRRDSIASSLGGAESFARPTSQQKRRLSSIRLSIAEPRQEDIDAEANSPPDSRLSVARSPALAQGPPPTPPKGPDNRLSRKMSFPHSVGSTTNYSPIPTVRSSRLGSGISFGSMPEDVPPTPESQSKPAVSPAASTAGLSGFSWGTYSLQATRVVKVPTIQSDIAPEQTVAKKIRRPPPPALHKVTEVRRPILNGTPSSSPSSLPSDASTPGTSTFSSAAELSAPKLPNGKLSYDGRLQPLDGVIHVDLAQVSRKRLSDDMRLDPPSPALSRAPSTTATFTMDDLATPQISGRLSPVDKLEPPRYQSSQVSNASALSLALGPRSASPPTPPKDPKPSLNRRGLKLDLEDFTSRAQNSAQSSPRMPSGFSSYVDRSNGFNNPPVSIIVTPSNEMQSFMDFGPPEPSTPSQVESTLQNFDFSVPESPGFDPSAAFSPIMSPPQHATNRREPTQRVPVVDRSPPGIDSAASSPKDTKARRRLTPQWAYDKIQTALASGLSSQPTSPRSPTFSNDATSPVQPHSPTKLQRPLSRAPSAPTQAESGATRKDATKIEPDPRRDSHRSSSVPATPTSITFRGSRSPFEALERSEAPKAVSRSKEREREKDRKGRTKERIGPEASVGGLTVARLGAAEKRGYDKVEIRGWLMTQRRDSSTSLSGGK